MKDLSIQNFNVHDSSDDGSFGFLDLLHLQDGSNVWSGSGLQNLHSPLKQGAQKPSKFSNEKGKVESKIPDTDTSSKHSDRHMGKKYEGRKEGMSETS